MRRLASEYGVSYQAIRQGLMRLGIELRTKRPETSPSAHFIYEIKPERVADAAYMAGMIDADGHITVTHRPEMTLGNTYLPMLKRMAEITGCRGHRYGESSGVYARKPPCLDSCTKSHVHSRKQGYRWILRGQRALVILKCIEPFLQEKRHLAQQAIELIEAKKIDRYAWEVHKQLEELGWIREA